VSRPKDPEQFGRFLRVTRERMRKKQSESDGESSSVVWLCSGDFLRRERRVGEERRREGGVGVGERGEVEGGRRGREGRRGRGRRGRGV